MTDEPVGTACPLHESLTISSEAPHMRTLGVILIVLGILGFVLGGISFTREETVADVGPLEVETERRETIPITPIASGIAVIAGIVLVVAGGRRSTTL